MTNDWLGRALAAKRDGETLDPLVWRRIVEEYVAGAIDDAPVAALLMACAIRGMDESEIVALTSAMVDSGEVLRFHPGRTVVDKHSTGGVGDTVSLIVVPLVAACGVPVAKLSGRALGHTGGTLDKLEAIPGVRTALAPAEFVAQVDRIGCAIAAQSERLVPADKKLYALRDRAGSVPVPGLIAASIVSKKIAGGAGAIVFDVKTGRGAFTPAFDQALVLARTMVRLCAGFGRRGSAAITDMDEPLGAAIGSGIEAIEARDFLRDDVRDGRLGEAVQTIAREMLHVGGVRPDEIAARVLGALESGAAYELFVAMIEAQGGTRAALEGLAPHPQRATALAGRDGFVCAVDTVALGRAARALVEQHGPSAGIRMLARVGTPVRRGEGLAEVLGSDYVAAIEAAFTIGEVAPPPSPLVKKFVRDDSAQLAQARR